MVGEAVSEVGGKVCGFLRGVGLLRTVAWRNKSALIGRAWRESLVQRVFIPPSWALSSSR